MLSEMNDGVNFHMDNLDLKKNPNPNPFLTYPQS